MNRLFLIVLAAPLVLSSCLSRSDNKENQAFLPPQEISTSLENALATSYFSLAEWPDFNWWENFKIPDLNLLIDEALTNNPTLEAINQKVEIAKQMTIKAKSPLFPTISFGYKEEWEHISKHGSRHAYNPSLGINFNQINLDLGLTYEFDFWGKYRNLLKASNREFLSQIAESRQVELSVSTSVAQTYFLLQGLSKKLELFKQLLTVRERVYKLVKVLQKHYIVSKIDPATAEQKLDEVKKEIFDLENQVLAAQYLLNVLRGQSPDAPLTLSEEFENMTQRISLPKDLSSDLLVQRPDLVASLLHIEALISEKKASEADFFPRINLISYTGFDSIGYKHLLDWQSGIMGLIPSLHLPIFKAGEIRAQYRVKQAELNEAIHQYNNLILKSLQEVTDALSLITSAFEKKAAQENILDNAKLKLTLVKQKTQVGMDSYLNLYYEKEMLIEKQIADIEIITQQYTSSVQLIKALGGGVMNEPLQVQDLDGS